MAAPQSAQPSRRPLNNQALIFAVALLLPGLAPSVFGWASGLLATLVFCLLCLNGETKGTIVIRNGTLLAGIVALFLKLIPSLLFSLTMVPLGYSFNLSYRNKNNEAQAGGKGAIILAVSWLVFWIAYGAVQNIHPYQHLLELLDTGFAQTYEYYRNNADIPADTLVQLGFAVEELRRIIPTILPGLLCCTVVITVWINLLFSASIIARLRPDQTPWKKYSQWRLPDKLVWFLIAATVMLLLGQGKTSQVATTIVLVTALLYFFQGLAVFIHLLEKWKIPIYLRVLIYLILILQSYGLIILMLAGLADVWLNFRRTQSSNNKDGDDPDSKSEERPWK